MEEKAMVRLSLAQVDLCIVDLSNTPWLYGQEKRLPPLIFGTPQKAREEGDGCGRCRTGE
jgi:hypothetical protein